MPENKFSLTRIFPYNDRIYDSVRTQNFLFRENLYSGIFYILAASQLSRQSASKQGNNINENKKIMK